MKYLRDLFDTGVITDGSNYIDRLNRSCNGSRDEKLRREAVAIVENLSVEGQDSSCQIYYTKLQSGFERTVGGDLFNFPHSPCFSIVIIFARSTTSGYRVCCIICVFTDKTY